MSAEFGLSALLLIPTSSLNVGWNGEHARTKPVGHLPRGKGMDWCDERRHPVAS